MSRIVASLPWITAAASVVAIVEGEFLVDERLLGAGAGGLIGLAIVFVARSLHRSKPGERRYDPGSEEDLESTRQVRSARQPNRNDEPKPAKPEPTDLGSLVNQMISDGRFALLLRPQIAG